MGRNAVLKHLPNMNRGEALRLDVFGLLIEGMQIGVGAALRCAKNGRMTSPLFFEIWVHAPKDDLLIELIMMVIMSRGIADGRLVVNKFAIVDRARKAIQNSNLVDVLLNMKVAVSVFATGQKNSESPMGDFRRAFFAAGQSRRL